MKKFILYGPPGTGKTYTLLDILEDELRTVKPEEIAFVSFTRKGAYEGRQRSIEKFGLSERDFPYFRTLHSIAFHDGGFKKTSLLSPADYKEFSDALGMCFLGYYTEEFIHNDDRFIFYDNLRRNNPAAAFPIENAIDMTKAAYVGHNFRRFKEHKGKIDFTDLLEVYNKSGSVIPVKVAIIDEAQDLTTLQWEMVDKAFSGVERMYIAGDDDQAIFCWAGADIDMFLAQDGEKRVLSRSYRLPENIMQFCDNVATQIKKRVEKKYSADAPGGEIKYYNNVSEINFDVPGEWLMLARNNFYLRNHTRAMATLNMLYTVKGKKSIQRSDLEKISIYERCCKDGTNAAAEIMLHRTLRKSYNPQWPWYFAFDWTKDKIDYISAIMVRGLNVPVTSRYAVNTIHGVKGGEADHVVVLMDITESVWQAIDSNTDNELRCLYVACSRAKKTLHIVRAQTEKSYERFINDK